MSSYDAIIEAALERLAEAGRADVLAFLTPERLAGPAGVAESTVRYHLRGEGGFDRERLAGEVLVRALEETAEAVNAVSEAIAAQEGSVHVAAPELLDLLVALISGLDPGGSSPRAPARERAYYLAIALCDLDPPLAAALRRSEDAQTAATTAALSRLLQRRGRRAVAGQDAETIVSAARAIIEGFVIRRRYRPGSDLRAMADAVLRLVDAFTEPAPDDGAPPPEPDSPEEAVRGIEAQLAIVDPLSERGLRLAQELLVLAPTSTWAWRRARARVEPLLAGPQLRATPLGEEVWLAATELYAMASADRFGAEELAEARLRRRAADRPHDLVRTAWLLLRLERLDDADELLARARELAGADDAGGAAAMADAMGAYGALVRERPDEAIALGRRAGDAPERGLGPAARLFGRAMGARALLAAGDLPAAERELDAAPPAGSAGLGTTQLLLTRGLVELARGRHGAAVTELQQVRDQLRRVDATNPAGWPWLEPVVTALVALGQRARAAEAVAASAGPAERWGTPAVLAAQWRATAALAQDDATRRELLASALAVLDASPLTLDRRRTQALLAPPAAAVPVLSPRVQEVAELVAEGLRDAEIAARLGLSVRTVHRHVGTALKATGTTSRTGLALAVRRDPAS